MTIGLQEDNLLHREGLRLAERGDYVNAKRVLSRAVCANPRHVEALHDLGVVYRDGFLDERKALRYFETALQINPTFYPSLLGRAHILLGKSFKQRGLAAYECRWQALDANDPVARVRSILPEWRGQDLRDKTIVVYQEQGFGDAIMFSRWLSALAVRASTVRLLVHPPIAKLFPEFHAPLEDERIHYQCSIIDLARWLPMPKGLGVPYIKVDSNTSSVPAFDGRPKVGVVWQSGNKIGDDLRRSMTKDHMIRLAFELPQLNICSLQFDSVAVAPVLEIGSTYDDFAGLGKLMKHLDLVVSVDTAALHLAGALGVPTLGLLHYAPCWRWGMKGERTRWYDSVRLLRQTAPGDWDGVISRVIERLRTSYPARIAA